MSAAGLAIVGSVTPGYPASTSGYGARAYGNTAPGEPQSRWLLVSGDGRVIAYAGKVEYGQNIRTGFAMEVADELRLSVSMVEVVMGDTALTPWDMGTFGSQSTARVGMQLRRAAATAREALLEMATARLDLPQEDLIIDAGRVMSRTDTNHSLGFEELIADQFIERQIDDDVELTGFSEFRIMGAAATRTDAEARVTGRAVYSQDVCPSGTLFARILRPPSQKLTLSTVDTVAAEQLPGVVMVAKDGDLIAILAENDESADRAYDIVQAEWTGEAIGSHLDIPQMLLDTQRDPMSVQEQGDVTRELNIAKHTLEAVYYVPHVTNLPMEPRAAVAQWDSGKLTVWAGTQRPFGLRSELATHFGMSEEDVRVIAPEIGGAFGTKSWYPAGLEAARLAKLTSRPVRVAYSRREDTREGTFRPAALIQVTSGFRGDGTITAWKFQAYHAGPLPHIARRGSESPYDVEHIAVTVCCAKSLVRVGSYRSLGGAVNHFATESHVDEIANELGLDPVELRLRNLSHPRFRKVLEAAAHEFGWRTSALTPGLGAGVAIGTDIGSYVASCFEVSVESREVKIERVVTALDCGLTVNPEGAKNQVEGSTIMGMGPALYEATEIGNGVVLNPTFTRYQVPRMNSSPDIEVVLTGDPETPSTGAGEPGIVTVAAGIANAVFDATGQRIRELPIQRHLVPGAGR